MFARFLYRGVPTPLFLAVIAFLQYCAISAFA
jgi:hypothetical protein